VSDNGTRIYLIGSCDGFGPLRDQLAVHPELDVVGESEHVGQAAAVLAGGHLDCIILATPESTFPSAEVAAVREHSRAPVIMIASGDAGTMLEQALDADVSDVLLLPQLTHNVVFAIRKAAHVRRHAQVAAGRTGRVMTVFSPKGGTGKTTVATNLAAALAKGGASARCCSTSTSSSATPRSCSGSSPRRRSTTSSSRRASSTRRSSPATSPSIRRASTSSRRRSGPRTPSS